MQFKTTQDVIDYITSLQVDQEVTITLPVSQNALFYDTVRDYCKRFSRQRPGDHFLALNNTTTPCQYKIKRLSFDVLENAPKKRISRDAEAKAISGMGDVITFPYSQELLTWVRTHVYTFYKGQFSVLVEMGNIVVQRKSSESNFQRKAIALISADRFPVFVDCTTRQTGYLRQIVSDKFEGLSVSFVEGGCIVYRMADFIEQAKENTSLIQLFSKGEANANREPSDSSETDRLNAEFSDFDDDLL